MNALRSPDDLFWSCIIERHWQSRQSQWPTRVTPTDSATRGGEFLKSRMIPVRFRPVGHNAMELPLMKDSSR